MEQPISPTRGQMFLRGQAIVFAEDRSERHLWDDITVLALVLKKRCRGKVESEEQKRRDGGGRLSGLFEAQPIAGVSLGGDDLRFDLETTLEDLMDDGGLWFGG